MALMLAAGLTAQEKEDRTLLSTAQMMSIINEASGERAMHHVEELVPYQRVRPASEYQGHFRESEVMAGFAKEYRLQQRHDREFSAAGRRPVVAAERRRAVDDDERREPEAV